MIDRLPPQNIEAEEALISAILIDNGTLLEVADILTADDFYVTTNGKIYGAIMELFADNKPADLVTVATKLQQKGELEDVGGGTYLAEIADNAPIAMNAVDYAEIIKGMADLRRLLRSSQMIAERCYQQRADPKEVIDFAERTILEASDQKKDDSFVPLSEILAEVIDDIDFTGKQKDGLIGISTGYSSVDAFTQGLMRSDLILLAGRPSMGKTAFALNIARNVAIESKETVAIFSLEMSRYQLALRSLSSEAHINANLLQKGGLSQAGYERIGETNQLLVSAPIYLNDRRLLSITDMRAQLRRLKKDSGLGLIIVDYLQLMKPPQNIANRVLQIGYISRNLKALAGEMSVPVIALSQLNRMLEQRADKRPILADLRDSGELEQDADVVAFIYRDEVYNKEDFENKGTAEIIIAKNRNGPVGTALLKFTAEHTRFDEIEKEPWMP